MGPDLERRRLTGVDIDLVSIEAGRRGPRPSRVLVVDDNPTIRDVLHILLSVDGGDQVDVRCVTGGRERSPRSRGGPN